PPSQVIFSVEGSAVNGSVTVTDKARNSVTFTTPAVKIDKTAPTPSATLFPYTTLFRSNNTNVTVSFSGTDALSGIDACASAVVLSTEGSGQSASGTCTDKAGNTSVTAAATGINIDKTAPTASATPSPAANANGWNNTNV